MVLSLTVTLHLARTGFSSVFFVLLIVTFNVNLLTKSTHIAPTQYPYHLVFLTFVYRTLYTIMAVCSAILDTSEGVAQGE